MPEMNIIAIVTVQVQHDVRVALVELSMELFVLFYRLKLLDTVNLNRFLTSLRKECHSLLTQLSNVCIQVFSVESVVIFFSFHHCDFVLDCVNKDIV